MKGKIDHTFEILTDSYALCITSIRCTSSADLSLNVISFGCDEIYLYKGQLSTSRFILSLYRRWIFLIFSTVCIYVSSGNARKRLVVDVDALTVNVINEDEEMKVYSIHDITMKDPLPFSDMKV